MNVLRHLNDWHQRIMTWQGPCGYLVASIYAGCVATIFLSLFNLVLHSPFPQPALLSVPADGFILGALLTFVARRSVL